MPTTGQIILVVISIALFVFGGAISLGRIRHEQPWSRLTAKVCLYFGMLAGLAALVWHSIERGSWRPLEDNFDAMIWLALVLAGFVLYVQKRKPLAGLDWFVLPIVVLLLIGAVVTGWINPRAYNVRNLWSVVHLIGVYGGAAAFSVAGAVGCMFLVANYRLRHKIALAGPGLGSLERLEHLTLTAVTLGFALLTIGAVMGFAMMKLEHRSTPPAKLILSAAVWVVYAVVLHSPINPSFRGRRAALLSILGFALMVGTVVAVLLMPEGT